MKEPNSNCRDSSIFESKVGHSAYIHIQIHYIYRSRARRHFYGSDNEIWADFGPVGNTEKKIGADYEHLLRAVFSCFQGQKKQFKFLKIL